MISHRAVSTRLPSTVIVLVGALSSALLPADARANCNVIPGATTSFRGALGSADRPFAMPGDVVTLSLAPGVCDAATTTAFGDQPGGTTVADDYRVTMIFTPPQGAANAVVLATDCSGLGPASGPITACIAQLGGGVATCVPANSVANPGAITIQDALHLSFRFPDTDDVPGSPPGTANDDLTLAGPAKIAVTPTTAALPCQLATQRCAAATGLAACIDELYTQDGTCRKTTADVDSLFSGFTALPPPNNFERLVNAAGSTTARFTIDAHGNALMPMDWQSVLVRQSGIPFPRLVRAGSSIDAFTAQPGNNVIGIPGRSFIASFSPEGLRLPPVFEPLSDPTTSATEMTLFGSVDAPMGVLRIARRNPILAKCVGGSNPGTSCTVAADCTGGGNCGGLAAPEYRQCTVGTSIPCASDADCAAGICGATVCYTNGSATATACTTDAGCTAPGSECGPSLFDFRDRFDPGVGPVVVTPGAYTAQSQPPVTLDGTQETQKLLAFVAPEALEGLDRNGDGDASDPVVVLRDRKTGVTQEIGPSGAEGRAVSPVNHSPFQFSAIASEGDYVAFLEPEPLQGDCWVPGCDQNADNDIADTLLRVYKVGQTSPVYLTPQVAAEAAPMINGKSLAISDGLVFFRRSEWAGAPNTTARETGTPAGTFGPVFWGPTVDESGRHVCFSTVQSLVAGDTNGVEDIYCRDRFNGTTKLASVSPGGGNVNGPSVTPTVSATGRFVLFASQATNLVALDTNGVLIDSFVRDRDFDNNGAFDETGAGKTKTVLVSKSSSGAQSTGLSLGGYFGSISRDGRFAGFISNFPNLVAGDTTPETWDYFVHDRDADRNGTFDETSLGAIKTVLVNGTPHAVGFSPISGPSLSADGRYALFDTDLALVAEDTNGVVDVYIEDRDPDANGIFDELGTVEYARMSVSSAGGQASVASIKLYGQSLSADGRFVAFWSFSSEFVAGDTNGSDVFLHDRDADEDGIFDEPNAATTTRVSVASDGSQTNDGISFDTGAISSDGRYVIFTSFATNLIDADSNGQTDLFVHDRITGMTQRVSAPTSLSTEANGASQGSSISRDGRIAAFLTDASNLIPGDTVGSQDGFTRGTPLIGVPPYDLDDDLVLDHTVLQILDARAATPTPTTLAPATKVATNAGNAVFLSPEAGWIGVDWNSDADFADEVVLLYHDRGTLVNLGIAARDVAIAGPFAGALVSEADQGLGGTNYNGDSDTVDLVPAVNGVASGTSASWVSLGFAADSVALAQTQAPAPSGYEGVAALLDRESDQGGAGDQTGDTDTTDRVLRVAGLDLLGGGAVAQTPIDVKDAQLRRQPAQDFVVGAEVVAFRTREGDLCNENAGAVTTANCAASPPGCSSTLQCDLDGDGDCCDEVMQAYDVRNGGPVKRSNRTALPCQLEACDPRQPYKVVGTTIRFLEAEQTQGLDLNADGDATDLIVQVYNVRSNAVQAAGAVVPDDATAPGAGPNPLDPIDSGGDGSGGGGGGGIAYVANGRCIENRTAACASASPCQAGEFCDAGVCKRDHGTCASNADCPTGAGAVCQTTDPALAYTASAPDTDGDSILDPLDNCPKVANVDQADADGDKIGNVCDLETCGNGVVEIDETCDDGNLVNGDSCSSACRVALPPCDDGLDNDGDGFIDYPNDPGCLDPASDLENPACDDGLDNDGDTKIDWDGGPGMATPDPECTLPYRNKETPNTPICGLGAELALVMPLLGLAASRRRRASYSSPAPA